MKLSDIYRYGSGCGVEIRGEDLRLVAVRSRPAGVEVLGAADVVGFRRREPGEWGREIAQFLEACGMSHVAVRVVPPRSDLVVRTLSLPAASDKELTAAVRYQLDELHPFEDDEVCWAWAPLTERRSAAQRVEVVVALARSETIEEYAGWFERAGVAVSGLTPSFAALRTALRVRWETPPSPLIVADRRGRQMEVFGTSAGRPLLSASFDLASIAVERAIELAAAELRVGSESPAIVVVSGDGEFSAADVPASCQLRSIAELFPEPAKQPAEFHLGADLLATAAALDSACPRLGWTLNLLPVERRRGDSRWVWAPTAALASILVMLGVAFLVRPWIQDRAYAAAIERRLGELNAVVEAVERARSEAEAMRARLEVLERLERRTQEDLAILSELSLLIPDSAWLRLLELNDDGVRLVGDAQSAAPLLGVLNEAKTIEKAAFLSSIAKTDGGERFQIGAQRRVDVDLADAREIDSGVPVQDAVPAAPDDGAPSDPAADSARQEAAR